LVSAQSSETRGVAFSSDGTKMYILKHTTSQIFQYTLSTPWNVSTATYASLSKSVSAQASSMHSLEFSPDGTKMFTVGGQTQTVYQYTLSTPWNVSTATYASLSIFIGVQESGIYGLAFSTDGTKMFIVGLTNKSVFQYTLSTPWNVSTATYASLSKSVGAQAYVPYKIAFSSDGTKMFILGQQEYTVYQYTLSTPWNVSTATYTSLSKLVSAQDTTPYGLTFSPDGTKMYIAGDSTDTVYQYTCNINQQVTYTANFSAVPLTPTGVLLPDLSTKQTKASFTEASDVLTITHTPVVANGRALQHKVIGDTDNEVTQVQTNLWKII